jgi:hypothetical protein
VLAAVALALSASEPLVAQEQVASPPTQLPLIVAAPPVVPAGTTVVDFGAWLLRPDVALKKEPPGSPLDGIPRWTLGFRAERRVFAGVRVGGMASVARGEDGPLVSASELGTGRDLSHTGSLTGPGTYRTVFNTALTVSVPLKETGRVNLKAVGELWNPFFGATRNGAQDNDVVLCGRAFKIGLKTTF